MKAAKAATVAMALGRVGAAQGGAAVADGVARVAGFLEAATQEAAMGVEVRVAVARVAGSAVGVTAQTGVVVTVVG